MSPRKRKNENAGLPRRWRVKHGAYYYRVPTGEEYRWDGKTEYRLGSSLREAYKTYAEKQEYVGPHHRMTGLCERYQLEVVAQKAPATQKSNRYSLGRIRTAFAEFSVADVTPQVVYQYRDHVGTQKSKKAANLDIEVLSHMFTKAIEWGVISDHPIKHKVNKFSLAGRKRYVSDSEVVGFAATLPEKWRLLVALAVWTGRRKGELLRLTRQDLTDSGLLFENNKRSGDKFIVAWTPEIRAIVQSVLALRGKVGAMHLFHTRSGQPYIKEDGNTSSFDSIWQRHMQRWGESHERFTFHDLRAKRASDLTREQAQALLRHTTAQMTDKYRRKVEVLKP